MATITGYTAEKMDEINNNTIVDANVVGDDLILTTLGGAEINAGNVRGDTGLTGDIGPSGITVCTTLTRPDPPYDGQQIYEINTFKTLIWMESKGGWFPPWNLPWGVIGKHRLTSNSSVYTVDGNTDMVIANVIFRSDRSYKLYFEGETVMDGSGAWALDFTVNGSIVGRAAHMTLNSAFGDFKAGSVLYIPPGNGVWTVRLYRQELSGAATAMIAASGTNPRQIWVEDVGPAV